VAGEAQHYPTAVIDLDGNERASLGLRNNSLNVVQILLDQLTHKKLTGRVRRAALNQLFATLDHVRPLWSRNVAELALELKTLRFQIADQQELVDAQPKSWTADDKKNGLDLDAQRQFRVLDRMKTEERLYSAYVAPMLRLLSLDPAVLIPGNSIWKSWSRAARWASRTPSTIFRITSAATTACSTCNAASATSITSPL
jgi:hypothetical protein